MYKGKKFLAVIPARGGSKRVPKKNILDLAGKPLIAWSIEAGLKSKYIDDVIVTSDCDDILKISKEYGAKTLKRPQELAQDTTTTFDTILHTLQNTEQYNFVILLQPTSPLRTEVHIDEAIELLDEKKADAIISICETEHSPLWSNTLPKDESMENFISEEIKNIRSQDLPLYYKLNGAIYICKIDSLKRDNSFFLKKNIYGYKMDQKSSIDIDTELDFDFVDFLIRKNINEKN